MEGQITYSDKEVKEIVLKHHLSIFPHNIDGNCWVVSSYGFGEMKIEMTNKNQEKVND